MEPTQTTPAPLTNAMLEIRISCPPVLASYLQELLWTMDGVESVSENYAVNAATDETQLSDLASISVLTRRAEGEDDVKVLMVDNPRLMKVGDIIETRWLEEKDWAENWKQYWHPTPITDKLTICPTWEAYQPKSPNELVLRLDPECAFGTGTHETTQLMLKIMESVSQDVDFSQLNVLDVGTGSGILAIYAAMKGCRDVRGIDNDAQAVGVAQKNAELNGVASFTNFTDTPLADLCHTRYDMVLVNIIAPVILELWPEILLRLNPGGRLLASGLIESSVGRVEAVMQEAGFTEIQRFQQGDWFALSGFASNETR